MISSPAARRYARALFGLAQDEGRVSEVQRELTSIAEVLAGHEALRAALLRPLHPAAQRRAVLTALGDRLGLSTTFQSFLKFLVDQRRLIEFSSIHAEYERLADEAAGRMRAEIVSANALPEAQVERLRRALAERSGRDVAVSVTVDESLLGGVIARVGDLMFDGSLRTQLRQLRANLTREV